MVLLYFWKFKDLVYLNFKVWWSEKRKYSCSRSFRKRSQKKTKRNTGSIKMLTSAKICWHLQIFCTPSKFRMFWSKKIQSFINTAFMAFKIFRVVKSPLGYLWPKQPATKGLKPWYGSTYCYIVLTNNGYFGPCNVMCCYLPPNPEEKRNNNNNDNSNKGKETKPSSINSKETK